MIRFFKRYQRSLLGLLGIIAVSMVMTSFGVGSLRSGPIERHAITVGDQVVTASEFYGYKQEIENRYRSMLKGQYDTFAKNLKISQQLIDDLVAKKYLVIEAQSQGWQPPFAVAQQALWRQVAQGAGFSSQAYSQLPRMLQKSRSEFHLLETSAFDETVQNGFMNLFEAAARPAQRELDAIFMRDRREYSVEYLEFTPSNFAKSVPAPEDKVLEEMYNASQTDFEIPEQVAYDYIAIRPADYASKVDVQELDVTDYYTDHESEYKVTAEGDKPARVKSLDEVRPEIEAAIRKDQAPTYAQAEAQRLFEEWNKSGKSLSEFATANKLSLASTNGLISKMTDPQNDLAGLSEYVVDNAASSKALAELDSLSVLVERKELKEVQYPAFSEVRGKLLERYQADKAKDVARSAAESALAKLSQAPGTKLSDLAKEFNAQVNKGTSISKNKPGAGALASPEILREVSRVAKAGTPLSQVVTVGPQIIVAIVTAIKLPDMAELDRERTNLMAQERQQSAELIRASLVNRLKKEAPPVIDEQILQES